ncbi:TIGR03560 family F420-dependent LLM class oxidoreductase [Micromonospora cathayae]|uniref:TIGR03560 family F420-dependent LLM class oxidoreductase n=1 Tax=Micromonospora cathayae TaxID=3028804 RepID=A0ABY7ZKU6_9ACTN|nr:TIGR03560 family F420-dependent LLM class oxidoreductase [Micromonospora sp. HUAS 3]WDZ83488.1 TIGR03560 family F420-dependent LLM class oxidoreductase [Micromonospora sp. HUAS 3]
MRIGMEIVTYDWAGGPQRIADTLTAAARSADDAGFSLIGVPDHVWQSPPMGAVEQPFLECFTVLAAIAAQTSRVRLAPMVAGVHFRAPGMLLKQISTLDVLSRGRALLGVGVGWYPDEALGMGVPFPSVGERFAMLEEALRIRRQLGQGDDRPFVGEHYRLDRPLNVPAGFSGALPPVLIGGGGPRTLRLVAGYGDACNLYPGPDLADKLALLRRYCDEAGRDYDAIEKTCILPFDVSTPEATKALIGQLGDLADVGVQTAIGILAGPEPLRDVEVVGAEVIPAVGDR